MGIASAHFAVLGVASIKTTAMVPLSKGDYLTLVPIALGLLLHFQLSKKYSWLAKISTSFLIALGAGIGVRSSVQAEFLSQIKATAEISLRNIDNLIIVAGTVSCVLFFYFTYVKSAPMRNLLTLNSKFAWIILMVSFGVQEGRYDEKYLDQGRAGGRSQQ